MNIREVDTPALIVNLEIMKRNIYRLQNYLDAHEIKNRPHIKTHKIPAIAHMQLEAGAIGIACQKLGEAEVMADAGIKNILITYNILGRQKLERLVWLAKRTELMVAIDNLIVAQDISRACELAGLTINVLVELGSKRERTGVPSPSALVELAKIISRLPGLQLCGLMIFPSSLQDADRIAEAVQGFQVAGLSSEIVSGGGSIDAYHTHLIPAITEHRAGTYIYNDRMLIDSGAAKLDDCALIVLTTVVSRPVPGRAIIDAGSKAFSSDAGLPMGYILGYPDAQIYRMDEEHGYVNVSRCPIGPEIGERLCVIPNHACGAVNMHDVTYGVREDEVEVIWDILARGKIR